MGFLDMFSSLGDWLNKHLGQVFDVVGKMFKTITAFARALTSVLGNVFTGHFHIFTSAAQWIAHAMATLVKKWIPSLISEVQHLYTKLRNLVKPVVDTIHRIRQIQEAYFNTYIRPILNFIQHLRQALVILRLMHVKFATQLDQRLANIEDQIYTRFMNVLREFNVVSDYINYILDPFGLFDSNLYLQTALRSIGGLFNALQDAQKFIVGAADKAANTADSHHFDREVMIKRVQQRLVTGPTASDQDTIKNLRAEFNALGYGTNLWVHL